MPPETEPTTPAETITPAPYVFPFEVPTDLAVVDDQILRDLHAQVRDHATGFTTVRPIPASNTAAVRACRDLAVAIAGELRTRDEAAAEMATLAAELEDTQLPDPTDPDDPDTDGEPPAVPDPEPAPAPTEPAPAAVTASAGRPAPPRVRAVASRGRNLTPIEAIPGGRHVTMRAAADVPGFTPGQELSSMADVVRALGKRFSRYSTPSIPQNWPANRRPIEVYNPAEPSRILTMHNPRVDSTVEFRRTGPEELRVRGSGAESNGWAVARLAAKESRLAGGSLLAAKTKAVEDGQALTAAIGWCAPSDTMYGPLLQLATLDGILDAPEVETDRGGWNIPENGGPDFAALYDSWGNAGNTHLTEDQVISGATKHMTDIGCPPFAETRLGVDYVGLTGGLLQRRAYPEAIEWYTEAALTALPHKINRGYIAALAAGSGSNITIPQDLSGDDAVSALLSGMELAIVDMQYRQRMMHTATMEVVLPYWVLVPMRAAMARRKGVATVNVTDAEILSWFTTRKAVPHFVYDWQDAFSGLATGPGGATALTHLPLTVQFLVYPAGTWVKAVQDVIDLSTLMDSTLLQTNTYMALFTETGWAAMKMGPLSRLYTVNVDPSGVVACCENVGS